ncbi:hypothetical protein PENTCL1PPCAC_1016, partial [Pristionchus entomophagus]
FDWDYCMLTHGGNGTSGPNGHNCPVYYGEQDKSGFNNNTNIFIVSIVLLTMISLLLAAYVWLLRKRLNDSIRQSRQSHSEDNAARRKLMELSSNSADV